MDLSNPLASLVRPLDAAVLRVLSRAETEFTGRQTARLAGIGTAPGIRNTLIRLAHTGLVTVRAEPHSTYYSANREHVLWPAVELALASRETVKSRIARLVEESKLVGVSVSIYGSVARDESDAHSDVDLLVVFPDDIESEARDRFSAELAERVRAWTGNDPGIYDLTQSALHAQVVANDTIISSWRKDAVTVAGPPIRDLVG